VTGSTISDTMRSYNRAFSALDPYEMARHFHAPLLVMWSDGRTRVFSTRIAHEEFAAEIVASMRQVDLSRSDVLELHSREMSPFYGMASWSFERIARDGRSLGRMSATYALVRTEAGGWAIATIMVHSFETLVRL
jgi:hypothetical protein